MLTRFAFAIVLIFATAFIHSGCTAALFLWFRSLKRHHWAMRSVGSRAAIVGGVVFLMSFAAYVEAALWGAFYVMVGALPRFAEGLYFSLVTYTTLGYGDITLPEEWRVLAAVEAVTGIIMFGWTTALIVAVVQRLFLTDSLTRHPPES